MSTAEFYEKQRNELDISESDSISHPSWGWLSMANIMEANFDDMNL